MAKMKDPLAQALAESSEDISSSPAIAREVAPNVDATAPDAERLLELWYHAYDHAVSQIIGKGLAFYTNKEEVLKYELMQAVKVADLAVSSYLAVRKTQQDVIRVAVQRWQKRSDRDNPLA